MSPSCELRHRARLWGYWASIGALAYVVIWLVCMIPMGAKPSLVQVAEHPVLFRFTLAICALGTLGQVPLLAALACLAGLRAPLRALVGGLIYFAYVPLNMSCYVLNGTIQPRLAEAAKLGPVELSLNAALDVDHVYSLWGTLDYLGYFLYGLGGALLLSALASTSRRWAAAAVAWYVTAALCTAAVIGRFLHQPFLEKMSIASGAAALVSYVLVAAALAQRDNDIHAPNVEVSR